MNLVRIPTYHWQLISGIDRKERQAKEGMGFRGAESSEKGQTRNQPQVWVSASALGSRDRHEFTLLGRAWPRIMSMVRFLPLRSSSDTNRHRPVWEQ